MITKAELARRQNVGAAAVSEWISRGKISPPALLDDGRIDYDLALVQLRERLDPARSTASLNDVRPEPALAERIRLQRIEENEIRLRRLRREELELAGVYVRADSVRRNHARLLAQLIASLENWAARDLPDKLGLDRELRAQIRREWRAWRQRTADHYQVEAEAAPEFEPDEEHPEAWPKPPNN